jgi:hypothetical protein
MARENRKRQNVIMAWRAKTAFSKLLVGKFGLGEEGNFLWTIPPLKTPTLLEIKPFTVLSASAAVVRVTNRVNPRAHKFVSVRQIFFCSQTFNYFQSHTAETAYGKPAFDGRG